MAGTAHDGFAEASESTSSNEATQLRPARSPEQHYFNASINLMLSALAASSNTLFHPPESLDNANQEPLPSASRTTGNSLDLSAEQVANTRGQLYRSNGRNRHHALRHAINALRNSHPFNSSESRQGTMSAVQRLYSVGMEVPQVQPDLSHPVAFERVGNNLDNRPMVISDDEDCTDLQDSARDSYSAGGQSRQSVAVRLSRRGSFQEWPIRNGLQFLSSATRSSSSLHPQFRTKAVCDLYCKYCQAKLCQRGMKAILLGNTRVELYSTDLVPEGLATVFGEYTTVNCSCQIRDTACVTCGNIVGYRVTKPCSKCLESCNNGHFWMMLSTAITPIERVHPKKNTILRWAELLSLKADADAQCFSEKCRR